MIIHDVAQRSPEWYALRTGIPTASEFSKIITSTGEPSKQASTYAMTLAAELYAGKPIDAWEGNAYTERGRELEGQALDYYAFVNGVTVQTVGFVTDEELGAGCSPDGLVGDDGMVEVKCLKAENHIKAILYHKKHGRCPTDYVQQTQGQLMICDRDWCDLLFYHGMLPSIVIRQERNPKIHDALRDGIKTLIADRDDILKIMNETKEAA